MPNMTAIPNDGDPELTTASDTAETNSVRPSSVVLDGANLAWTYSAALYSKLGCRTRLPLSRGVVLALEHEGWRTMGLEPVAFMPASYVEGPLHGLADGGSLETLVPGNVRYLGGARWRNVVLHELLEAGRLRVVERPHGARDADDRRIIAFARESNAAICSNDGYEDHIAGAGSGHASKTLRRWLARHKTGYEFSVGNPMDAAYAQGKAGIVRPPVGCVHLSPPPRDEARDVKEKESAADGETAAPGPAEASGSGVEAGVSESRWRADVHATGSSRPWALGASRWGKHRTGGKYGRRGSRRKRSTLGNKGGVGRKRKFSSDSDSELDDEFPFWALPDKDLPVTFRLKKVLSL